MVLKERDFIEIEFTGKTEDGEIFDSNIKEDLEKANLTVDAKPFIFALGQEMFLKGVDNYLIGKPEESKSYEIPLSAEESFGKRNPNLIERIPSYAFKKQNINPVPGVMFNFDGRLGKVIAASGGRVVVDFNNPIAGKNVIYNIKILRKVEDLKEKVEALNDFFFRKKIDFDLDKEKNKIKIKPDSKERVLIELFKEKFKEILGVDLEIEEPKKEEKEEKEAIQKEEIVDDKDTKINKINKNNKKSTIDNKEDEKESN